MAPTTSSSRCLVARRLGLTAASQRNRFGEHLVTDLGPQGREWHDVGSDAHDPLDVACYAAEGQDAGPLGEVDEESRSLSRPASPRATLPNTRT